MTVEVEKQKHQKEKENRCVQKTEAKTLEKMKYGREKERKVLKS